MTLPALPAWSEPFTGDRSGLARADWLRPIDRTWAFEGSTGAGVRVAIIDSGLDADHPALGGRVVERVAVELVDDEPRVVPDPDGDRFGHGTACAGIVREMAPDIDLVSVRVLGADLRGRGAAFLGGLRWAIEHDISVVNLSLSSRSERLFGAFHEVADQASFAGVHLVCAANNVRTTSYPSLFASVISVAAHDVADPWCWFHDPAPPVEFGAWGVDVPVAWSGGATIRATGNSFAAPRIAGLVARLLAAHPGLTPAEVKAVLAATADRP